jgi:hypothetical protein
MKIQCLQKQLGEYFASAEMLNRIPPDEVIAIGAANEAAILTGNEDDARLAEKETVVDCLLKEIQVKVCWLGGLKGIFPILALSQLDCCRVALPLVFLAKCYNEASVANSIVKILATIFLLQL